MFKTVLVLALLSPVVSASAEELTGLSAREAGAVRKALFGLDDSPSRKAQLDLILRETFASTPSLEEPERARIRAHLERHLPTRIAVEELLNLRRGWRPRGDELFVFWWNPAFRDVDGFPARSPTVLESQQLNAVVRAAASRLDIEPPEAMPYRIDPRAESARTHPRTDLRWGVWAADTEARAAVVEAVARERGGVPGLWKPLGSLLGTCHGDPACRAALLERAELSAAEAGHVPVLELLTAGTLGGLEDPAFATAVLLVDLLLIETSPETLGALLSGLEIGLGQEEVRRVLRAVLGSSPERFDRRLNRDLLQGRRDRLGR